MNMHTQWENGEGSSQRRLGAGAELLAKTLGNGESISFQGDGKHLGQNLQTEKLAYEQPQTVC